MKAGGTLSNISTLIDNGTVVADGAGSNITATLPPNGTPMMIGDNGTGTLIVSNGAAVDSNGQLNIGQNAGDHGTVTVTSGAQLSSTTFINVGQLGIGTLTVSAGGTVNASSFLSIADDVGSNGPVLVTGSGSSVSSQNIEVGNHDGTGSLTVANGGTVTLGAPPANVTEIGAVVSGSGVKVLDRDGAEIPMKAAGWQHF